VGTLANYTILVAVFTATTLIWLSVLRTKPLTAQQRKQNERPWVVVAYVVFGIIALVLLVFFGGPSEQCRADPDACWEATVPRAD